MQNSHRYDDMAAYGRGTRVQKERFALEQYVRVQLNGNRTEIGVVADINEVDGAITVTTRHGYDVTVRPEAVQRAFLVVLDLNGVLGARNRVGFKSRPHVAEFVKFVFNHFAVAVWTSGLERTSAPIIEAVFEGYQDRLLFTLFRDACTPRPTIDNPHGTFKDLQRIFDSYPQSFHSVNTIIIDDSPDKCSHPDIALCPIPFKDTPEQPTDSGLVKVMEVLQQVLDTDSIHPLIRAAEERLALLRSAATTTSAPALVPAAPTTAAAPSAEDSEQTREITLWRTRLCCENLRGCCRFGDECRFSHDADDGKRPCSHKNTCRFGHASRWVPTVGDAVMDGRAHDRARFTDRSEQYFLSKEELAAVQRDGRSHTGIPRLDAQNESERAPLAPQSQRPMAGGMPAPRSTAATATNTATFSTNPHTTHHNNSVAPARFGGYPTSAAAQQSGVSGTSSSSGGLDVNRFFASATSQQQQQQHAGRPRGNQGMTAPQPRSAQTNQPRAVAGGGGGGGEVHLHGNQRDGTALLKQLEMLTKK